MPHNDRNRIARIEALAAEWTSLARATQGRTDARSKRLRARALSITILLADLRKRLAAVASTTQELDALLIEEGAEDMVEETAAARAA